MLNVRKDLKSMMINKENGLLDNNPFFRKRNYFNISYVRKFADNIRIYNQFQTLSRQCLLAGSFAMLLKGC